MSLVPSLYFNTGGDVNPVHEAANKLSLTALGFRLGYDRTKRLTVYWNRGVPESLNGRYYNNAHVPVYGVVGDDLNDSYGLSYALTRDLSVDAGYTRRWRIGSLAAGDPTNPNPAFYSGAYLAASWRCGPNTRVGRLLTVYATATDIDHDLNATEREALPDHGLGVTTPGWEVTCTSCGVTIRFPVFGQTMIVPRVNYQYSANYAQSSVYPPYANIVEWGADASLASFVTLGVTVRNYQSHEIGFPYPTPQNQHYTYALITANFHTRLALPR